MISGSSRSQHLPLVVSATDGRLQLQRKTSEEVANNRDPRHSLHVFRLGGGGFSVPSPGLEAIQRTAATKVAAVEDVLMAGAVAAAAAVAAFGVIGLLPWPLCARCHAVPCLPC